MSASKKDTERRSSTSSTQHASAKPARSTSDMDSSQQQATVDKLAGCANEAGSCVVCSGQYSLPGWAHCSLCEKVVHIACIHKQYKATGADATKNNLAWIHGLLSTMTFRLVCPACVAAAQARTRDSEQPACATVQQCSDVKQLREEVTDMKMSLTSLSGAMNQLMQKMSELNGNLLSPDIQPSTAASSRQDNRSEASVAKVQPQSYASLVSSKTLTETVKEAVTASLRQQSNMTRDKASVVIYGLAERRQDCSDVGNILRAISVSCSPIDGFRLGKAPNDSATSRPRPLKVIFSSEDDKYMVLRAARHLKDDQAFRNVRISKYLSSEEMIKLKATRAACDKLNKDAGCHSSPKQYIVIDGEIKVRGSDGKLKGYKPRAAIENSASTVVSEPKNGVVGSQVAPST
jgi:hypothetical protein